MIGINDVGFKNFDTVLGGVFPCQSYKVRYFRYKDKTVVKLSYLYNAKPYTVRVYC